MRWLAIDGGGTKAKLRWEDSDGNVEERNGGPCNWATTRLFDWQEILEVSTYGWQVDAVYGCFAGVLRADEEQCARVLKKATRARRARAESDCAAALASFPDSTLVGVIAGTGSSIFSRIDGQLERSGGGGPFLGDPGSAVDIMRRWMNQHIVIAGGKGHDLDVYDEIAKAADGVDRDTVLRWLYEDKNPAPKLAALFPALARSEPEHPAIRESFRVLADQVNAHVATCHPDVEQPEIGLTGGVWQGDPSLREQFAAMLNSATIVEPSMTPVEGAMRLAKATFS